jgi:uncharacterized protein (DUF2141 family)
MSSSLIGIGIATVLAIVAPCLAQTTGSAPTSTQVPVAVASTGSATLVLTLRNLKFGRGAALVFLYSNGADWAANRAPFRKAGATGRNIDVTYTGLKPGLYAAKVFYDVNDNDAHDPGEPVGYTNDAAMSSNGAEPQFNDAAFQVTSGVTRKTVVLPDIAKGQ